MRSVTRLPAWSDGGAVGEKPMAGGRTVACELAAEVRAMVPLPAEVLDGDGAMVHVCRSAGGGAVKTRPGLGRTSIDAFGVIPLRALSCVYALRMAASSFDLGSL